jgi:hypothetical protein
LRSQPAQVATNPRKLNALDLQANAIQQARNLPNLEFLEFQCLSKNPQTESDVSFSTEAPGLARFWASLAPTEATLGTTLKPR